MCLFIIRLLNLREISSNEIDSSNELTSISNLKDYANFEINSHVLNLFQQLAYREVQGRYIIIQKF